MKYRFVGKTGLRVSEFCLGTMTFGREADASLSHQMLDLFAEAGGNFIDTANVYSGGMSEQIIGDWLSAQNRDDFVVGTKVRFETGSGPNAVGLSRKHILSSVKASLARLQTDYIDLYQVHSWDAETPIEETLSTLNDLVRGGVVRYIGASNMTGWQLQKAIETSRRLGLEAFSCLQPRYNLLCRSTEWELIPICKNEGLGMITWSPLRGGWLSGKFQRGLNAPPTGSRIEIAEAKGWGESWSNYDNDYTWRVVDALHAVAEETGKPPAQVALRWLLQQKVVTAPILGASKIEQLKNNLGAAEWELSEEHMKTLTDASEVSLPYPYDFEAEAKGRR